LNGNRGGEIDTEALLILCLILALVLVIASRGSKMPTNSEFEDLRCDGNMSRERGQGKMGVAGEYQGQAWPGAPQGPEVPQDDYPNLRGYGFDADNPQFSSKMSGDPIDLMESTRADVQAHADMNAVYGLNQPVATLGSHPFLRDELSNPTELEPGNAAPFAEVKIPKRR
jgi:hypothetical protein